MTMNDIFRSVGVALSFMLWSVQTLWFGVSSLSRLARVWSGARQQLRLTLQCPRGHTVPAYSRWKCSCGAELEGHAFERCPLCGAIPTYVPCDVCLLPIANKARL